MTIDIDKLTEAELIDLNRRIVARVKFIQQMRTQSVMLKFHIAEKVAFQPSGYPELIGTVIKHNRKSVTVIDELGQTWNVAPALLRKVTPKPVEKMAEDIPKLEVDLAR